MVERRVPEVGPPSGRVPGRGLPVLPISEARRRRNRGEITKKGSVCRGIGTRVGSPKRKQPFKTRMDRLGCSWAELGKRTADFSKAIIRTECQQSAQAQPA